MPLAPLVLTEEQELLQQTAREFVAERAPVSHLRALRDSKDRDGFSRALWREMAELGWAGIIHPERFGGIELGYAELGVVLEECGRTLVPEPFLSTVVLGGELVRRGAPADRQEEILSGVCKGDTLLAVAFQEQGRFDPWAVSTKAEPASGGFRLTGRKRFVLDGHVADHLIVVARTAGGAGERAGLSLFLVPRGARGVSLNRTVMVDSRNAADVSLDGVEVARAQLLGELDGAADLLEPVFDRGVIALSAQLLGVLAEAFDRTIAYLKERKQFDVKIGSFQALKHRAAQMFAEVELSRSVVLDALRAIDENRVELPRLASLTKARVSDTAGLVTREAIQMHGGIGMTDEAEIGFFLKRARAAELTLGDGSYHRDRFARLCGY
jgi:alkylation response protein AidB-like acyl-CoA dehydrogenase